MLLLLGIDVHLNVRNYTVPLNIFCKQRRGLLSWFSMHRPKLAGFFRSDIRLGRMERGPAAGPGRTEPQQKRDNSQTRTPTPRLDWATASD